MIKRIILFILFSFLFACSKSPNASEPLDNGGNGPSQSWSVTLGESEFIPNTLNVPVYPWFPDGHISIIENPSADSMGRYTMFWSEFENYRSIGPTPFPEDQRLLDPKTSIFGGRGNWDNYNNGGSWLMSVFRQSGNRLIGFYHAEDHWYPRNAQNIAWKSTGVAISEDNGHSWEDQGQIITPSTPKPTSPEWGGSGDCCVIWHEKDKRWICYYSNQYIRIAISKDTNAAPGTWYKYHENDFKEPALGGKSTPISALRFRAGANPSVHFNTYLQLWIMVYHAWNPKCIYISSSEDGYEWSLPRQLVCPQGDGRAWYPTIIGETDIMAGKEARLYYSNFMDGGGREFLGRSIQFIRND